MLRAVVDSPMERRIYHIQKLMSEDLARQWSLEEMANRVGLSVPRFKHLFKEITGLPPMTFLFKLRLKKARDLLAQKDSFLQIKEIRRQCGIYSEDRFSKEFKKVYGLSPVAYRERAFSESIDSNTRSGTFSRLMTLSEDK